MSIKIGADSMERYKEITDKEQLKLTPMFLEDNIARAIDAIVENMNIHELGFTHSI